MKKIILAILVICTLLAGCGATEPQTQPDNNVPVVTEPDVQSENKEVNVQLNKSKLTIHVGESFQIKAMGASAADVKWSSSNKKVASVSEAGVVKGKKKGSAKITAEAYGKTYVCKVKVKPAKKQNNNTQIVYDFRNPSYLTEHYKKHGIEMGFTSEDAYLKAANKVIANPSALHKLEKEDDDHIYYIESTDEIVFLSQDGYIRTYFICSGKSYFDRQ